MKLSAKCVLFDLDGTLVDTAPDLGYAANLVRADLSLPPLPIERYRPVASAGARGLLKIALDIDPDHAEFPMRREAFLRYYRDNLSRSSRLFEGMDAALTALEQAGLSWGVVTNKPGWLTRPLLADLKLDLRAACAVSGDDVPRPKPAPDSLLKACTLIDLAPRDCVYVGDDRRDIVAGQAAGMHTVAAEWGYLGDDGPIASWHATTIVARIEDLPRLFV